MAKPWWGPFVMQSSLAFVARFAFRLTLAGGPRRRNLELRASTLLSSPVPRRAQASRLSLPAFAPEAATTVIAKRDRQRVCHVREHSLQDLPASDAKLCIIVPLRRSFRGWGHLPACSLGGFAPCDNNCLRIFMSALRLYASLSRSV